MVCTLFLTHTLRVLNLMTRLLTLCIFAHRYFSYTFMPGLHTTTVWCLSKMSMVWTLFLAYMPWLLTLMTPFPSCPARFCTYVFLIHVHARLAHPYVWHWVYLDVLYLGCIASWDEQICILLIRIAFCHVSKELPLHCLFYVTINICFCFLC